jgi:hypothetical protein
MLTCYLGEYRYHVTALVLHVSTVKILFDSC